MIYRASHPSCQPLISLCAKTHKNLSFEPATPKNYRVQHFGELRGGKFWTLPFSGVASPELSNFRGWPVQDSVFFLVLGWQEGLDTLYMEIGVNTKYELQLPSAKSGV